MKRVVLSLGLAVVVVGAGVGAFAMRQHYLRSKAPEPTVAVPESWHAVRAGFMHDLHVGRERIVCSECHAAGTFASPPRSRCEGCHEQQAHIQHGRQPDELLRPARASECIACHAFDDRVEATRWQCLDCHREAQGRLPATSTHADEACGHCHAPHGEERPEAAACDDCHGLDTRTLGHERCAVCHTVHGAAADARARCSTCHALPAATFEGGHESCATCHAGHAFDAQAAVACGDCHRDHPTLAAERVPQHRACTACHDPHEVRGAGEQSCRGCHSLAVDHPPSKASESCLGCHPVHPAPTKSGEPSKAATRARLAGGGRSAALACTSCHGDLGARSDGELHGAGVACTGCHRPHAFGGADARTGCTTCHVEQARATVRVQGHEACAGCHQAHPHELGRAQAAGSKTPAASCRTCHADVHVGTGHDDCRACHDPHTATARDGCAGCHGEQAQRARAGHRRCLGCHAPHAPPKGGASATPSCLTCHGKLRGTPHADARACTICHDPHGEPAGHATGATMPGCRTCHTQPLPGLHGVEGHDTCARCHGSPHAAPQADRAACIACHQKQRNHEPEAETCGGCHLFRL